MTINSNLSRLNEEQRKQILMQWEKQQHDKFTVDFDMSGHGDKIPDFIVNPGVWDPTITSAQYHASYLYYNNERLFKNKRALDMGTGTGLMGVVMALQGAKSVMLSDISLLAVDNAVKNITNLHLEKIASVKQGDLFESVNGRFEFIVFNHPFFGDEPPQGDTIATSMLNSGDLIDRFLRESPKYLVKDGIIMMPWYTKAGEVNNPAIQGSKHGFSTVKTFETISNSGLQTGEISIFELKLNVK